MVTVSESVAAKQGSLRLLSPRSYSTYRVARWFTETRWTGSVPVVDPVWTNA